MKLVDWVTLVDDGFSADSEFKQARQDIVDGIADISWPPGADGFTIRRGKNVNGVKPIKDAFTELLQARGWELEQIMKIDALLRFDSGTLPFAVEWETGNISSSHRAINRLGLCMDRGLISGGVLVVPSHDLYYHLTDRVGNFRELEPYLPVWRRWDGEPGYRYLAIVVVEHDALSDDVPAISKGTDGRALV